MNSPLLLSTAYFPPIHYLALAAGRDTIFIEKQENYIKQTYRNRCCILTSNGVISLTVPVLEGSFHKTPVRDIKIDYSRRWQQVHTRALISAYRSSPFFEFYFDDVCRIINSKTTFLLDLNLMTSEFLTESAGLAVKFSFTTDFKPVEDKDKDLRYALSPKNWKTTDEMFNFKPYIQVFPDRNGFIPGLSGLDLIFNTGPEAVRYLPDLRHDH
ncbi:MAG: WbqC family protein [Bacteroidales bacterium]|nr:WbqC family protein [Bacteroidales bacterium]